MAKPKEQQNESHLYVRLPARLLEQVREAARRDMVRTSPSPLASTGM